jgi:heme A synthase
MYGFFFISVPIIITISLFVILVLFVARVRKIENTRRLEISFYLLLFFLAAQAGIGFLLGKY